MQMVNDFWNAAGLVGSMILVTSIFIPIILFVLYAHMGASQDLIRQQQEIIESIED